MELHEVYVYGGQFHGDQPRRLWVAPEAILAVRDGSDEPAVKGVTMIRVDGCWLSVTESYAEVLAARQAAGLQ